MSASKRVSIGLLYYLIFEVKQKGALPESLAAVFQAEVRCGVGGRQVQLCGHSSHKLEGGSGVESGVWEQWRCLPTSK